VAEVAVGGAEWGGGTTRGGGGVSDLGCGSGGSRRGGVTGDGKVKMGGGEGEGDGGGGRGATESGRGGK